MSNGRVQTLYVQREVDDTLYWDKYIVIKDSTNAIILKSSAPYLNKLGETFTVPLIALAVTGMAKCRKHTFYLRPQLRPTLKWKEDRHGWWASITPEKSHDANI